jgi:hypothetical protein
MYLKLMYAAKLRTKLEMEIFQSNRGPEKTRKMTLISIFKNMIRLKLSTSSMLVHSKRQPDNDISAALY